MAHLAELHMWRISNSFVPVQIMHIPVAALFLVRSFFSVSCTDLDQEANDRAGSEFCAQRLEDEQIWVWIMDQ